MCGITGAVGDLDPIVEVPRVIAMRDRMQHRGPDGEGVWASPSGSAVLGHRRLAIVDLSDAGHQPMSNEDGSVWITFNGEIYNAPELRARLRDRGHTFVSETDTECIVHLYEERGIDCVHDLDGDFAFGLWDEHKQELLLVRDRLGVKPLYYTWVEGRLLFASEIKAFFGDPQFRADIDEQALYHYLTFLVTPTPHTLFDGVFKLPAGHRATVRPSGGLLVEQWWNPVAHERNDRPVEENVERVRSLLRDSVRQRMISDVPFGVFLSGGLDSSLNVALMSEQMSRPVDTYSVAFADDPEFNELEHARAVAQRFGANHREVVIDSQDLVDFLPDLVVHQDEPLADPVCVPLHYVARLAKTSGTTVVQVGEGADETFCGYAGYLRHLRTYRREWRGVTTLPSPLLSLLRPPLEWALDRRGLTQHADVLRRAWAREEFFWGGATVFTESQKAALVPGLAERSTSSARLVDALYEGIDTARPDAEFLERMTYLELRQRLPELLLMRVDKMTMATTVEARVPFLDHRLVEFALGLSERQKVQGGTAKYLLKRAAEGLLPDEVIYRKKQGFGVPISSWFRGGLGDVFEAAWSDTRLRDRDLFDEEEVARLLERHRSGAEDNGFKLWVLLNLVLWYDRWIDPGGAT